MKKFFFSLFISHLLTQASYAETHQTVQRDNKIINLQHILTTEELKDITSMKEIKENTNHSIHSLFKILDSHHKIDIIDKINSATQNRRDVFFQNDTLSKPIVLLDGDSWASNYRFSLDNRTENKTVDHFIDIYDQLIPDYRVRSLASANETLAHIIEQKDYVTTLKEMNNKDQKPKAFIISAGLNDIIEQDFSQYIYDFDKTPKKPTGIPNYMDVVYLLPVMATKLDAMKKQYQTLISDIHSIGAYKNLPIFINSYDYGPYPYQQDNEWIVKPLLKKGYVNPTDQRFAYIEFLDSFNDKIKELIAENEFVYHIDSRRNIALSEWQDTIHPNAAGYQSYKVEMNNAFKEADIN